MHKQALSVLQKKVTVSDFVYHKLCYVLACFNALFRLVLYSPIATIQVSNVVSVSSLVATSADTAESRFTPRRDLLLHVQHGCH